MSDQPFQPQRTAAGEPEKKPLPRTRDVIEEALRKQAQSRPQRPPAVLISTLAPLPRQPKPALERKLNKRRG